MIDVRTQLVVKEVGFVDMFCDYLIIEKAIEHMYVTLNNLTIQEHLYVVYASMLRVALGKLCTSIVRLRIGAFLS